MSLADAEGLATLTMRRLAADLGVEAMSLYQPAADQQGHDRQSVGASWATASILRHTAIRDAKLIHDETVTRRPGITCAR